MIMNEPNEPLQRTSINVFTQFPADPEDGHGSYELLEQRAIAFGVAINFYFGDEPYLVGCFNSDSKSKDEISRMRELAFVTGGFFIVYQGDTTGNVIPSLLPIQTNPQLYYYDSRPDCSQGLNVSLPLGGNSFQNTNGFRVIVSVSNGSSSQDFDQASLTAKCHIGGLDSISWLASSSEPGVKIFNLTTLFVDPCPIQLAPIHGASCSIQIYHNGHPDNRNSDNSGLQVYTTYTDSPDVDSSYINMAVGAALYSRVHIQSDETESYTNFNVTEISFHSSNGTSSTNGQAYHPHSTFEFVTNNTFTCQLSTLAFPRYWLNVKFTANNYGTPVDVIRTVPVKCYSKNLDPGMSTAVPTNIPSATTTMVEEVTTTKEVPTTQTASTTITTDSCIAQSSNAKPVIVVGWSRQINTAIAKNFVFGLSSSNLTGVYQKYGLLPINQVIGNSFPCSRAVQFYSSSSLFISGLVALVNSINGNSCGTPTTDNFIDLVQNHDTDLPQGSILTFLVDDTDLFPDSNLTENIITIQRFATTKRYHINFIVDNSYSSFYSSSTYDFYQTLATLTDGHFIRMDTNQDITQVTMDLFSTYFTNRLVLSRELYTPNYDVYAVLGTVDLTSGDQTLYLTASVNDISSLLWLTYEVTSLKTNKTVANTTGTVTFGLPMSLYYTQLVNETVPGNDIYQITITKLVGHSSVSVFRVWQKVPDPDLFAMNIKYLNSNAANYQPPLDQGPDEKSGVISQLDVFDNSIAPNLNIELEIYDCNGNLITNCLTNEWQECILDGDTQTTRLTNNDKCANSYIFSPFFCKAQPQTCLLNTFNYYNVKYKAVNLYTNATYQIHSRFLCPNVNITTTDCKNGDKKVIDNKCDCSKSDPPFWRGPTCQIQDCSGNGDLIYNGTVFYCNCSHGFNGQSCEQGYCVETNTEAGALDNFYRTLTIGLVFNSNDEFTSVQSYTINTLKAISNPSNIWQYHLFIGCAGFVQSIYLGSSFDNLNSSLNSIDSTILAKCFIQNQTDLTPLVEFGLRPLGREIRGLFWLSSGNSLNIYVDQPDSSSLESFYRTIYGYRQELYITSFFNSNNAINVNNTTGYESTAYATRATGGQRFDIPIDQIVICYSDWLSLIISTPTSINYYLSSNKTETIPGIYVEANAYVFVSGLQSIDVAVTPAMPFICPSSNSNQFTGWINLTTSQSYELTATVSSGPLNLPYAVVVRVPSSAYDISTIFVDKLNEDRPKALPLVNA
uniref:EGF-like domain-containing protein n=1 Tax=Acrobeloides nanus TaxID=290746 RepID=A0A914BV63_9BILA